METTRQKGWIQNIFKAKIIGALIVIRLMLLCDVRIVNSYTTKYLSEMDLWCRNTSQLILCWTLKALSEENHRAHTTKSLKHRSRSSKELRKAIRKPELAAANQVSSVLQSSQVTFSESKSQSQRDQEQQHPEPGRQKPWVTSNLGPASRDQLRDNWPGSKSVSRESSVMSSWKMYLFTWLLPALKGSL